MFEAFSKKTPAKKGLKKLEIICSENPYSFKNIKVCTSLLVSHSKE